MLSWFNRNVQIVTTHYNQTTSSVWGNQFKYPAPVYRRLLKIDNSRSHRQELNENSDGRITTDTEESKYQGPSSYATCAPIASYTWPLISASYSGHPQGVYRSTKDLFAVIWLQNRSVIIKCSVFSYEVSTLYSFFLMVICRRIFE